MQLKEIMKGLENVIYKWQKKVSCNRTKQP